MPPPWQFGMELRELEAVSALSTLSQVSKTQLDTQAIMHLLSVYSEVTFRKVLGSAEILPTRPGIDQFEDTRPAGPWIHRRTGVVRSLRR